jgi:hypothetical protein
MFLRLLSLTLVFIITTQRLSFASTILLPYSPQVVEQMVNSYNALSQEERKTEFDRLKQQLSAADQLFIEKNVPVQDIQWPDMKFENGDIGFTFQEKTVFFSVLDGKMTIQGKTLDLRGKTFETSASELEKLLTQKSTSLIDLLIPSAYAFFWIPIIIAALAIAYAYQFFFKPGYDIWRKNIMVKTQCMEVLSSLEANDINNVSATDAQRILAKSQSIVEEKKQELKENCSSGKIDLHCNELKATRDCYANIIDIVEPKAAQVNDSSRGWFKDFFSPRSKSSSSSSATGR